MEPAQILVLFLTFACALGGLLLAYRVERKVTRMFGGGSLKDAVWQFFSNIPDEEGNPVPPQAALYAFARNIAVDCTDHAIEQLPGALVSLKGSSFAKKAAKHSAFARGAQNLSEGGFGELNGLKEMGKELFSQIGVGSKGKGSLMDNLLPMFLEKAMSGGLGGLGGDNGGQPPALSSSPQSQSVDWHPPV